LNVTRNLYVPSSPRPGACDRIVEVPRASDAFGALALDVATAAFKPLDALFALPRVVCVEIEQRDGEIGALMSRTGIRR
jgi:hypothetical protein